MTCNHCPKPCECGAEAAAGLRLLHINFAPFPPFVPEPQWPELEAMEAALANYAGAA